MLKSKARKNSSGLRVLLSVLMIASILLTGTPFGGSIDAQADTYPEWNASTAYPSGSIVTYDGAVWQSRWYNVNEPPADVQGNAWECIIPKPLDPPAPPENPNGYEVPKVFFDDFNMYNTSSDQALLDFGYEVSDRTGGPGPGGCVWKKDNVTFVADPANAGNKFLRLTATTRGGGDTTTQAELMAPREFLYGTYAARVKFANAPAYGPDGDQIVETFYTISPWTLQNSSDYGEMDFEYLANGGWGKPEMTMWNTTWETASTRDTKPTTRDFDGWHTCVIQCTSTDVKYYIDGSLLATHTGIYPPETDMFLSFNLWFIDGVWAGGNEERAYVEDVDWVYYAKDKMMVPAQAECNVEYYRRNLVSRKDTIANPVPPALPAAGSISVDSTNNAGDYTLTAEVPANNTADTLAVLETINGVSTTAATRAVSPNSAAKQTFTFQMANKASGVYTYRVDLANSAGKTSSSNITVNVINNKPGAAILSVDNPQNTGTYAVTAAVPAGNTGTSLKLYEEDVLVMSKQLTANSSTIQSFNYTVTNKPAGTYTYRADISNASGTSSTSLDVVSGTSDIPVANYLFDDFNYSSPNDQGLANMKWVVREGSGGPGPGGCSWSKSNVSFVDDTSMTGNKIMRLSSSTGGYGYNTSQSEVYQQGMRFFEGTYAARVKFTDAPVSGTDGDQIVETFFTISPLNGNNDPKYSELDFEYLANGGWGVEGPTMWNTSWYTYTPDPWSKDNVYDYDQKSYAGWHDLVCVVSGGEVKYYIDGVLKATHNGKYYPRQNMSINFNLWFINTGLLGTSDTRTYIQDVDWVYHAKNVALTPAQVTSKISGFRAAAVRSADTIDSPAGPTLKAPAISVDNASNTGNYTVTITVPANNTATGMKLYEGPTVVLNKALTANSSSAQTFTYAVTNKPSGTYTYRADASDNAGTVQGNSVTVTVAPVSNPTLKAASINADNANNTGSYTVTVTVPANNSATTMKLYEGTNVVLNKTLTVNSASAQTFTYPVSSKAQGTYIYRADVNDAANTLQSSSLTVTVGAAPAAAAAVSAGTVNNSTGSYTVTVTVPANTAATNVKLYETIDGNAAVILDRAVTPNSSSGQIFTYSAEGKATGTYTYRADLSNSYGIKTGTGINVTVTRTGTTTNVAAGKGITSSIGPIANGAVVTDGDKTSYNLAGVGEGLQWIQIDLGQSYTINKINMWHYFGDGRTYQDVIVRVSNTADFSSGVTTVYNNDSNNSAGFGAGTAAEYAETASGKTVNFNTVNARYIRLYINGNSVNPYNHFVEVEAWTA